MLNSSFFVGKAEAWGMKQLSLTFGAQVQIYFCTTLDSILVLGAVLAWGSLKERTFQKAGDGWRWKVGCGINRSQAFSLYLNHVQFLMPTSDSKDPGQVWMFLSWPCLWWSSGLSFSPTFDHLWRRAAVGQWLPFSIFLRGHHSPWGGAMLCCSHMAWLDQYHGQCSEASLTLDHPCSRFCEKGHCKTGLHSNSSVCDETNIYKDGLLSCLHGQDRELGPLVPILFLAGRWPRTEE